MPIDVLMPALSPTMEKGNLSKWLKSEGDKVKAGDVIAEIETDKATMEVEAVDEGTLGKILIPEGTADVAVNTPRIAVILGEGVEQRGRADADLAGVLSQHVDQLQADRVAERLGHGRHALGLGAVGVGVDDGLATGLAGGALGLGGELEIDRHRSTYID